MGIVESFNVMQKKGITISNKYWFLKFSPNINNLKNKNEIKIFGNKSELGEDISKIYCS